MKTLLILEHDNHTLKSANYHLLSAVTELRTAVDLLILGYQCDAVIQTAECLPDVEHLFVADHEVYAHQLAENSAALIAELAKNYDYVVTTASTFGKNLLPRVAALLDVAMVGDVIKIISEDTFVRPIYAGNAFQTVQIQERIKLLTIRPTAYPSIPVSQNKIITHERLEKIIPNALSQFVNQALTVSERPELTAARIIVAGGRGLKSAENFKLIEKLADRFGAAVGASRAAVDAGFAPNDYQVGQTGKVVAPDLYIAIGISGAIQHLAGMKDSKVIVAINNDPDAPIFQVADYGLVADLFSVLKELEAEL